MSDLDITLQLSCEINQTLSYYSLILNWYTVCGKWKGLMKPKWLIGGHETVTPSYWHSQNVDLVTEPNCKTIEATAALVTLQSSRQVMFT